MPGETSARSGKARGSGRRFSVSSVLALATVLTSSWVGVRWSGLNLSDVLGPLAIISMLLERLTGRDRVIRVPVWLMAPTLAAAFIVCLQAFDPDWFRSAAPFHAGATEFGRVMLSTVVMGVIVLSESGTFGAPAVRRLVVALVVGVVVSAAVAASDEAGITSVRTVTASVDAFTRATGLSFHPNSFALALVIVIPYLIDFTVAARNLLAALVSAASLGLVIWALIAADSRIGILVGVIIASVSAIVLGWAKPALRGVILVAVVLSPVLIGTLAQYLLANTRLSLGWTSDQSSVGRGVLAERGLEQWQMSPVVGVGLGGGNGVSVPVLLLSSGGLLLLGAFAWMHVRCFVLGWRGRAEPLAMSSLFSATSVLAIGIFSNSFAERFEYIPLFAAAAIGILALAGSEPTVSGVGTAAHYGTSGERGARN